METATSIGEREAELHSDQVSTLEKSGLLEATAARVADCVVRAFNAIGASPQTQEIVFWNIYVVKNVGRKEVIDKAAEFVEGVRGIYGEVGTVVFESMLKRELRREFGPTNELVNENAEERSVSDLVRLIRTAALKSANNP